MERNLSFAPEQQLSRQAQQLVDVGRQNAWEFLVLGRAPMPTEVIQLTDWDIVPIGLDQSPIPDEAMERVRAVHAAGLRFQGFVVVHEKPKALPAPQPNVIDGNYQVVRPKQDWHVSEQVLTGLKKIAVGIGVAAAGIVVTGVVVVAVINTLLLVLNILMVSAPVLVMLAALILAPALGLDPVLVAVTEDGTWIELYRWIEEE